MLEVAHALTNGGRRINVKRRAKALRQSFERNIVALQPGPHGPATEKSFPDLVVGKGWWTAFAPVCAVVHLRLGSPFTHVTFVIHNKTAVVRLIRPRLWAMLGVMLRLKRRSIVTVYVRHAGTCPDADKPF